ncbi:hypothetical protein ABK040_000408 [Willaertia magna]
MFKSNMFGKGYYVPTSDAPSPGFLELITNILKLYDLTEEQYFSCLIRFAIKKERVLVYQNLLRKFFDNDAEGRKVYGKMIRELVYGEDLDWLESEKFEPINLLNCKAFGLKRRRFYVEKSDDF